MRKQLLDALYAGQPFRAVLRDLGLTSNRVFGLTRTDQEWSEKLDAALTAARREDIQHGTNAAYIHGCVCKDCRDISARQDGQEPWLTAPICTSASVVQDLLDSARGPLSGIWSGEVQARTALVACA